MEQIFGRSEALAVSRARKKSLSENVGAIWKMSLKKFCRRRVARLQRQIQKYKIVKSKSSLRVSILNSSRVHLTYIIAT